MLVDPIFDSQNPLMNIISALVGNGPEFQQPLQLESGVYEINHFNGEHELNREHGWAVDLDHQYPKLVNSGGGWFGSYGVCDHYQQVLEQCPMLITSDREFVVFVTAIHQDDEPEEGGWRWHKWGEYIGTQNPMCEYLYDELYIDLVYTYHICERKKA